MWDGCGLFCPAVRALGVTGWFVTGATVKKKQRNTHTNQPAAFCHVVGMLKC